MRNFLTLLGTTIAIIAAAALRPDGRHVAAASAPAGLPAHFGIGVTAPPSNNGIYGWMPNSGIPWDYAYQYLGGGTNTGGGWQTWNTNADFPLWYAQGAAQHGYIPVFSYYEMLQSNGSCGSCGEAQKDLSNLNNASTMSSYFSNFRLLMQRLGSGSFGRTAIVHIEPDLSGYAERAVLNSGQCYGYCNGVGNNPANLRAAVASSGDGDAQGFPNTYQGFNWALQHIRDRYAPNVLLAFHVSSWSTGNDVSTSTDPSFSASTIGQEAGSFAAQSGTQTVPSGVRPYDLLFTDVSDRDAGYYKYVWGNSSTWWDRLNVRFPNFHRWESYIGSASQAAGKQVMLWQVPIGNQYFDTENNTNGHYQDNRAEYFFSHIGELAQNGIIGMLFGAGNSGSTVQYDGNNDGTTNPSGICTTDGLSSGQICANHVSGVSDDDGGYIRMEAQQYYQSGGYQLGGGYTPPAATNTPVPTPVPTSPPATQSSGLVLGNFEGTSDGFVGAANVTAAGPSTWSPTVALGSSSLWVGYNIPTAWSEAQVAKTVNQNLSAYSTLSASVYPLQPTTATGVKVRFMVQGSNGSWYSSPYQNVNANTRTTISWNMSSVPRSPLNMVYVCWQFTSAGVSSGNQLWIDDVKAS